MTVLFIWTLKHPLFLLLLLGLPLIYFLLRKKGKEPSLQFSRIENSDSNTLKTKLRKLLPLLTLLSAIPIIIGLSRPQEVLKEESVNAESVDIMVAIDVSASMLSLDFKPNRLEVAKKLAKEFVEKREYDRIGLVAFAAEAFTKCPLTTDRKVLAQYIDEVRVGELIDGTAIGMGLATAVNRMADSSGFQKVIILLTDGVNNSGYIQPETAATLARDMNIKVYTIAVGSEGSSMTPTARRGNGKYDYTYVPVYIDEDMLKAIAAETGGAFFRARDEQSLRLIYEQIDQMEKREIEVEVIRNYRELYRPWIMAGLLLFVLVYFLNHSLFRSIP